MYQQYCYEVDLFPSLSLSLSLSLLVAFASVATLAAS